MRSDDASGVRRGSAIGDCFRVAVWVRRLSDTGWLVPSCGRAHAWIHRRTTRRMRMSTGGARESRNLALMVDQREWVAVLRAGTAAGGWTLDPQASSVQFAVKHFWGAVTVQGQFER